ncbi:amine sulfotransferase-like [Rhipicephalus sanguineus]|uniref:amine sulfotransferase-like n=1 Tax=Rhipicephalus sanguineus TaxID=34632 RepID=UPI0020C322C0|nr:amine sulfotransferase-like [Rhipicephalus sanguineus]
MIQRRGPAKNLNMDQESYRFVEGVWMHKYFRDEAIRSAIRYKPREGDIVVVMYGDYFDHLLPWYERRNDANVLFLTYEELRADTRGQVLQIADFLGKHHAAALREDNNILQEVLTTCSLQNMKAFFSEEPLKMFKELAEKASENFACAELLKNLPTETAEMHEPIGFVRKGTVGDWRNHFTPEQINQMKEWIAMKTRGCDVMTLWNNCDLP